SEFGRIGVIMFFISISNVFIESGLGGALVRKKEATKLDYSSVFVVNLFVSLFCFFILSLFSGDIAKFYRDDGLQTILIVANFILIINAFQFVQNARLISEMRFKQK